MIRNSFRLNLEQCGQVMDAADTYMIPWTYWDSDFYDENFHIIPDYVNIFARVYPMATNGLPVSLKYNSTSKEFFYSFNLNMTTRDQASLSTDIFVPGMIYPQGFTVKTSVDLQWKFDSNSSKVIVTPADFVMNDFEVFKSKMMKSVSSVTINPK